MTPFRGTNRVTSAYGPRRSPISGRQEQHKGEDIVAAGAWPGEAWLVRECSGGTVLRVTSDQWRGNYVDVQTAPGVFERYQHMHEIYVRPGQGVPQGCILGMAGKTGDSTGPHLHFEVQKNGVAVNPAAWSDLPNAVGICPGNDKLDGEARGEAPGPPVPAVPHLPGRPVLYEHNGIVASPGDAAATETLLAEKAIPFVKKEAAG